MFYQQHQQQQPGGSIRIEWQTAIVSENKPNLPPSSTSEPPSHSLAPLFEDTGCFLHREKYLQNIDTVFYHAIASPSRFAQCLLFKEKIFSAEPAAAWRSIFYRISSQPLFDIYKKLYSKYSQYSLGRRRSWFRVNLRGIEFPDTRPQPEKRR